MSSVVAAAWLRNRRVPARPASARPLRAARLVCLGLCAVLLGVAAWVAMSVAALTRASPVAVRALSITERGGVVSVSVFDVAWAFGGGGPGPFALRLCGAQVFLGALLTLAVADGT